MGQYTDINALVGKRISYHDGFTNDTYEMTIAKVEKTYQGYKISVEETEDFFHLGAGTMQRLLDNGKAVTIDYCACKDTFKIQG